MDLIKHLDYFNPQNVGSVAIVGVGALGSAVALEIAKLGVTNITIYDDDIVEAHNLPNQLYGLENIDEFKIVAARKLIEKLTGTVVNINPRRVIKEKLRFDYVFCCVDSMAARKQIFNNAIYLNFRTKLYIEGRMNAETGWAYIIDPRDGKQVEQYLDHEVMYPDTEVLKKLGNCQVVQSIGATAHMLAGIMTWQFMQAIKQPEQVGEVYFCVNPWDMKFRKFATAEDGF